MLIDSEKLHLKLLDMDFPIQDQDPILDAMDDCVVDAALIVRCKNCIHYRIYGKFPFAYYACGREGAIRATEEDDFCKYGEKKS